MNQNHPGDAIDLLDLSGTNSGRWSCIRPSTAVRLSVLLILLMSGLVGCDRSGQQSAAAGGMPPPLVSVTTAVSRDVPLYLEEPVGKAVATELVTIQPQITGMLMARHFEDGADVHKGDLLFEIDPRPFVAALDQAKATLLQNQAALDFAHHDYDRVKDMKGTSAMSEEEIDQKKNGWDVAAAQVKAGQAAVETANLNLEYCSIRSPIDGRTGHRLVDVGNVASSSGPTGGTSMLVIQKIDPIYVDFTITENELPNVRRYMESGTLKVETESPEDYAARITASAVPTTQQASMQPHEGKLVFLDNSVQDGSGTVKLRALVANADRHFWPGQFVHVRVVLKVQKDAVLIPAQATQISQKGPFVYVVKADTAELRPIVAGQRQGDMVVVDQGVAAGENVIVNGQLMVMPGAKVTLPSPPPADQASQQKADAQTNHSQKITEGAQS